MKVKLILSIILLIIGISLLGGGIVQLLKPDDNNKPNIIFENSTDPFKTNEKVDIKTKTYSFDSGRFSLSIPEDFILMDEETRKIKYPDEARPDIVYTNKEGTIDIAISITDRKPISIEDYTNSVQKAFEENYGETKSIVYEKNNHPVGEVKLITPADEEPLFNNMMFFKIGEHLRIITFNCEQKVQTEWEKIGDYIMDSLVIED